MRPGIQQALVALAFVVAGGCGRTDEKPPLEAAATVTRSPGGGEHAAPGIALAADARARIGLTLTVAAAAHSDGEREAYGRVLDVASLSEELAARETARAVRVQARSEYARVLALHRLDRNASTRELEGAALALQRAEQELAVAQARLQASWGETIAARDDLPALATRLARRSAALARIEVPSGQSGAAAPTLVQLSLAAMPTMPIRAALVAAAPTTDPLTQGQGFLVLIEPGPPPPGTALTARLRFADQIRSGVQVPPSAVVWMDGAAYVFVEGGPTAFQRRPVVLLERRDGEWLVTGIEPGTRLVATGAQELLSEEILSGHEAE